MLNQKKIIVVMPAYNAASTLEKTYGEIPHDIIDEIILVDDGSKDRTADVIRQLTQEFAEVRGCFHRMNCGQSAALATGFRYAKGDIIVRCPSV